MEVSPIEKSCNEFFRNRSAWRERHRNWNTKQAENKHRDISEFVAGLKLCSKKRDLEGGKTLHKEAVAAHYHTDKYVASALIRMYMKCRSIHLAKETFDTITYPDAVAWTCLILGYVENGASSVALELFTKMNCKPNDVTYIAVLKACARLSKEGEAEKKLFLEKGTAFHKEIEDHGFDNNIVVLNTLLYMYGECGGMQEARELFERMVKKDVVSWNNLLLGYVENRESSVALEMFNNMDCEPDLVTYLAALKACASLASDRDSNKEFSLERGTSIHKQVRDRGYHSDLLVASTLVDMYGKCGCIRSAREVFDGMLHKNAVAWSSLILGYVENRQCVLAMELFASMNCEPDHVTYVAALKACACLATEREYEKELVLKNATVIHKEVREHGYISNVSVANTLLDVYRKCGGMQRARDVFEGMRNKNVVTWNTLILGYVENGESSVAMDIFSKMDTEPDHVTYIAVLKACACLASERVSEKRSCLEKGIALHTQVKQRGYDSDIVLSSTLVDMYGKCGHMHNAMEVFQRINQKDTVTWNCLLLGYVENGECSAALELFLGMDCEPNSVTYAALFKACASLAALPAGQWIHSTVCKLGLEDQIVTNALLDFYGKCGNIPAAEELFNSMHSPSIVSWTALISGHTSLGDTCEVFILVNQIREAGLQMDSVAFICILTACSHAGLVTEGKKYFETMCKYGIRPTLEHYNCMVDMLGRANRLEEAFSVIKRMPLKADEFTWTSVLGACRKWKNLGVGKVAFDELVNGNTHGAAPYVMMRDIYGSLSMWKDWEGMDAKRKAMQALKQPGQIWWSDSKAR